MSQFSPTIISNTKSYELFTSFQQDNEPTFDAKNLTFYKRIVDDQSEQTNSRDTGSMAINTEWLV